MQIAEAINDLIVLLMPFAFRKNDPEALATMKNNAKEKFLSVGARFETILKKNGGVFLVGDSITYADILLAHAITWFVEELGPEILDDMPLLVGLQNGIISLADIQSFIRSKNYYPIGDAAYAAQVNDVY
jgi:glutathione S-transferase